MHIHNMCVKPPQACWGGKKRAARAAFAPREVSPGLAIFPSTT